MTNSLIASATRTLSIVLVAVLSVSLFVGSWLHLTDWYAVKATSGFALVSAFVIALLSDRHPFERFGAANQITAVRLAGVLVAAAMIGEPVLTPASTAAAAMALIVTLLDWADGWLARRNRTESPFGARFDMEVDALLILVLAILAWRFGKAGVWVLLSGLLRYGFLVSGWLSSRMGQPLPPSRRRQAICVVQIVALIVVMTPSIQPPLSAWVAAVGLLTLCYSFLLDTLWLWRQQ